MESLENRLAQAMADLESTQAAVAKAGEQLRQASHTVRSKDRSVEVCVGPQGELTELRFLDGKYRNMGASELSNSVLEAVGEARGRMARQVMQTFKPFTETNKDLAEEMGVDLDWGRIFGPDVLGEEPETPTRRRRRTSSRLRDEISEDEEDGRG
jgi:DNA-binding protein YbaB